MGCGGSKQGLIDSSVQQCIDLFQRKPMLQSYKHDLNNLKNVETAYSSSIFGGSPFLPIGSKNKQGALRDKKNPMEEEVLRTQVNYLYGGGFYTLRQVQVEFAESRMSEKGAAYMDISILVESIDELEEMKKYKVINDTPMEQRNPTEKLLLTQLAQSLNGYGRIIQYRAFGADFGPKNCCIEFIQEGHFKNGKMDGYCRMFDARAEGSVQVGYFREGIPMGKFQKFAIDGTC